MEQSTSSPLISIITVVYNSVNTLEQTIQSVLTQTYQNIEYIIIDGGSTDGSVEIIKKHSSRLAKWVSEKDNGIYDAINKGLRLAKGELIGILNSDDWYEADAVEKTVNTFANNPSIDIFHGLLQFVNKDGVPDLICGHLVDFLDRGMIEHPTCFIKRSLYKSVGEFSMLYKSAADYDWMLRARNSNAKFLLMPYIIANFRRGGASDSYDGFAEELLIKKRYQLISLTKYSYWKLFTILRSILKK